MLGLCLTALLSLLREVIDFGANNRLRDTRVNARSTVFKQSRSSDFQLLHIDPPGIHPRILLLSTGILCVAYRWQRVGPRARKNGAGRNNELGAWRQGVWNLGDLDRLVNGLSSSPSLLATTSCHSPLLT